MNRLYRYGALALLNAGLAGLLPAPALAADLAVEINHLAVSKSDDATVWLDEKKFDSTDLPGRITFTITGTCATDFTYKVAGVTKAGGSVTAKATGQAACVEGKPVNVTTMYSAAYSGYIVDITRTDGATAAVNLKKASDSCKKGTEPECESLGEIAPRKIVVPVTVSKSPVDFSAGFFVSSLTDKKFMAKKNAGGTDYTVKRDKGAEDDISYGPVALVTLRPNDGAWGGSMGLALGGDNKLNILLGGSYAFNKELFLTVGANIGKRKIIPSGIAEGDVITDAALVNNAREKTAAGGFLAITYKFFGGKAEKVLTTFFKDADGGTTPAPQ